MSQPLLVQHPSPHPTESLLGYVVRLTEANGYASPRDLYRFAGMNENEISASTLSCSKLAVVTTHPSSWLERIAFSPPKNQSNSPCLLGNILGASDLALTGARVCPDCVADKGFIEAHWHIDFMWACPIHERAAVWYCPKCKKPLSWMRSGLLTCRCGAPFQPPSNALIPKPELALLDVIRRKALGDHTLPPRDSLVPDEQLAAMSLHSLLSLIRLLGKSRILANLSKKPQKGKYILQAAAAVLTDWPVNFQKLLRDLSPQAAEDAELVSAGDFAAVYDAVGKRATARFERLSQCRNQQSTTAPTALQRITFSRPVG
jgi:hypothetical protein